MNTLMPRFRGRAYEKNGTWHWEVNVTILGSNDDGFLMGSVNSFTTKEEAIEDMKVAIKIGCDTIQKQVMGEVTGEYIDMKSNETLKWDTSQYN